MRDQSKPKNSCSLFEACWTMIRCPRYVQVMFFVEEFDWLTGSFPKNPKLVSLTTLPFKPICERDTCRANLRPYRAESS